MFKRTSSVAILLILILSFTLGPVGNATAYQTTTTVTTIDGPHRPAPGLMAPPELVGVAVAAEKFPAAPAEVQYTTVVVDMDSIHFEPPFPGKGELLKGQLFTRADAMILTGNYITRHDQQGALVGNAILYEPGDVNPKKLPVRWEANGTDAPGKPEFFAHMKIAVGGIDAANRSGVYEFRSKIILNEAAVAESFVISQDVARYNQAVKAGDDNWHTVNVAEAIDSMDVDLMWEEGDSDLRLMIYTPDGKVLGPYYDDADGKTDGRIYLNITNSEGLAAGEWYLKVSDTALVGETDYYVKTS